MQQLFTVGHGSRTTAELAAVLQSAEVPLLVDVRRFPGSRRSPHLARERLAAELPRLGIAYEWWGDELGGRRRGNPASRHPAWRNDSFRAYADFTDGDTFRHALARLLQRLPAAVMCAETLWWRCHRRLIADAAELAGTPVVHLLGAGDAQPHVLHPAVRAGDDGWPVYDRGVQAGLW